MTWIILTALIISGCLLRQQNPPPGPEAEAKAVKKSGEMQKDYREPLTGPVSLEEALARAAKYSFDARLGQMASALAQTPFSSSAALRDDVLYSMLQKAAYYNPDRGGNGVFSEKKFRSIAYPAGDTGEKLTFVWKLLDFGLSYATDRRGNTAPVLSEATKEKVLQNIFRETRLSYYNALRADALEQKTAVLLEKARTFLRHYREKTASSPRPGREALEKQRQMIETVRFLWDLLQKMNGAKAELAGRMGMQTGMSFDLGGGDWGKPQIIPAEKSMMDLELLALMYRKELQLSGNRTGLGVYETRKALQRLHPDITFDTDYRKNRISVPSEAWENAGREIARQLFSLPAPGTAAANSDAAYARQLPLNMAVVTRLHLSLQYYATAAEEYRLSRELADVNRKLNTPPPPEPETAQAGEDVQFSQIRKETDTLMAEIRYYRAFAETENAAAAFYHSLGLLSLPLHISEMTVSSLTDSIAKTFAALPSRLRNARPSLFAYAEDSFAPSGSSTAAGGARTAPDGEKSGKKAEGGYAEKTEKALTAREISAPGTRNASQTGSAVPPVITQSREAAGEGRKPVREISIFRDVVNIHFSPSYQSPVKGQGLIGERYPLLAWSRSGWLKIEMGDGSPGWIPTKYVRPVETPVEAKTAGTETAKDKTPAKSAGKRIQTLVRANVRSAPSLQSAVIYIEDRDTVFQLISSAGEWFKIKTSRGSGWLHQSVVKVLSDN